MPPKRRCPPYLLAICVLVASCGLESPEDSLTDSDGPVVPPVPAGDFVDIELIGGEFRPADTTIAVGRTVRWINRAGAHTVTPDGHARWGSQSVGRPNQTFEHTFTEVGDFAYLCEPHSSSGMRGVIRVR